MATVSAISSFPRRNESAKLCGLRGNLSYVDEWVAW